MKKYIVWILILTILFTACQPVDPANTDLSGPVLNNTTPTATHPTEHQPTQTQPTEPRPTETQPIQPNDYPADMNTDEATVTMFQELFADRTWFSAAIYEPFEDPKNVLLDNLFYAIGFQDEPKLTKEERAELVALTNFEMYSWMDGKRFPIDKMDQVLQKVFGIGFKETTDTARKHLLYLESTNCYYYLNSGAAFARICVVGTRMLDNGNVEVYYCRDNGESNVESMGKGVATLKPVEDGYHILSNRLFE